MFIESIQYDELRPKRVPVPNSVPWVVLAEDQGPMRELLTMQLSHAGFQVTAACDGAELASILGEAMANDEAPRYPDAIVSDVRMPAYNGMSILESVREAGWSGPVIMISAFADRAMKKQAEALDATLLSKPEEMHLLIARVKEAVQVHRGK